MTCPAGPEAINGANTCHNGGLRPFKPVYGLDKGLPTARRCEVGTRGNTPEEGPL
jgi:hypothetical protein